MKKGGTTERKSLGFTIVETMIVLAVSGGLFLVAALYISGKQAKTDFQVGVRDVQTKIQQIINEVNSGYYPNVSFTCAAPGGGTTDLTLTSTSGNTQGTNDNCMFVGKTIVVSKDMLYVFSLAGKRTDGGKDITDPANAQVTAIAPATGHDSRPGAIETYKLPNGLTFTGKYSSGGASQATFAFSFMNSFAQAAGNTIGSQAVDLRAFNAGFGGAKNTLEMADLINGEKGRIGGSYSYRFEKAKQAWFCLQSGGTEQSAWIKIGDETAGTAVRTEIKGNTTCS